MHLQFSSVVQSCPTLCDPMNCNTPGLPVHHQLLEFTQTHVHRVSDAIQPSHPLSSPFPPAPIPPSIRVFSNESTVHMRCPKYWNLSFNMYTFNIYLLLFFICYLIIAILSSVTQSCPTLCDPMDSSPPGSPVPGILQARTLEWVAISFSNA